MYIRPVLHATTGNTVKKLALSGPERIWSKYTALKRLCRDSWKSRRTTYRTISQENNVNKIVTLGERGYI